MKIYSKKKLVSGILMVLLGGANLLVDILTGSVGAKGLVLVAALFLFGADAIRRSLSKQLTQEDRLEELDERNRLIELKAKSRAFQMLQGTAFVLMLVSLVAGKVWDMELLMGTGLGAAVIYAVSIYAELGTFIYYEKHT